MLRSDFSADNTTVRLPAFFASVSSVKTSLSVSEYLRVLVASGYPNVLISAFDLHNLSEADSNDVRHHLNLAMLNGRAILFDSGNYESFWTQDATWTQERFHGVLGSYPCSFTFSYDVQSAEVDPIAIAQQVVASLERDQRASLGIPVVPIVHGTPSNLPRAICEVVRIGRCKMIAVPERELGAGICERATTVRSVRKLLDDAGLSAAIHLLGTGNPLSIATYTLVGADSFDGLEWCQTAVDPFSGFLHHLSQAELFWSEDAQKASGLGVGTFTLLENMRFFERWLIDVQEWSRTSRPPTWCPRLVDLVERIVGRIGR